MRDSPRSLITTARPACCASSSRGWPASGAGRRPAERGFRSHRVERVISQAGGNYYIRAGNYCFTADRPVPPSELKFDLYRKALRCFHAGFERRYPQIERFEVPFEGANARLATPDDAQKLYAAVSSKNKTIKIFTVDEGGAEHCHVDNRQVGVDYVADWITANL